MLGPSYSLLPLQSPHPGKKFPLMGLAVFLAGIMLSPGHIFFRQDIFSESFLSPFYFVQLAVHPPNSLYQRLMLIAGPGAFYRESYIPVRPGF